MATAKLDCLGGNQVYGLQGIQEADCDGKSEAHVTLSRKCSHPNLLYGVAAEEHRLAIRQRGPVCGWEGTSLESGVA